MQATFRFNGSEEIVVTTTSGGVLLEVIESHEASPEEKAIIAEQKLGDPQSAYIDGSGFYRRTRALVPLSKGSARSVASAMMQAAAEA